jgi:tRNA dimethylallyltransferase
MEPQPDQSPLIVIVGETASGKSALALDLAQQFNGEIIAADSRTVYRGMDIGTAKPDPEDQALVPHHLIDVVTPGQRFTVSDFKTAAIRAIADITGRGRVPFLVGGTGLYVDAVVYDFSFRGGTPEMAQREKLLQLSVGELQSLLAEKHIKLPENERNPRHLIRALETGGAAGERQPLRPQTLLIGLNIDRGELRQKITDRVDSMVDQGFIEEVKAIAGAYGWEAAALRAPGYRTFRQYIEGTITLPEAKELFVRADLQLAKRQRTWFKRNKSIHWLNKKQEAVDLITTFLNK